VVDRLGGENNIRSKGESVPAIVPSKKPQNTPKSGTLGDKGTIPAVGQRSSVAVEKGIAGEGCRGGGKWARRM